MEESEQVAWKLTDEEEGRAQIVFAATEEEAHATGEIGFAADKVERAPEFDRFSPGPVPAKALLDAGWWYTCQECEHHVAADGCEDCGERLREETPHEVEDPGPVYDADDPEVVYCSQDCKDAHESFVRRLRDGRAAASAEVSRRFPEAVLLGMPWGGPEHFSVDFTFPGSLGRASWATNDPEHVQVERRDLAAWETYRSTRKGGTPAGKEG